MRSRSSLLSHLLGSHPEIYGYSELHSHYATVNDLLSMQNKLTQSLNCHSAEHYFLDKILHNYAISDTVLNHAKTKVIFLLRKPESTIKSIIKLGDITGVKIWHNKPLKALNYYRDRLLQLQTLATRLQQSSSAEYFFIESDKLIEQPGSFLAQLQSWLKLGSPIRENYSIFEHTGKAVAGDPSKNIKTGKIIRTQSHPNVVIEQDILEQAQQAYKQCMKTFLNKPV